MNTNKRMPAENLRIVPVRWPAVIAELAALLPTVFNQGVWGEL